MAQGNQREAVLYAYLAGILDGEGCFRIAKNKPRKKTWNPLYVPYIQVGMSCKEVVELLQTTFGGCVRQERVLKGRKPIYRWSVSSKRRVARTIKKVRVYLIEKREQAEALLDFCKRIKAPENRQTGLSPEELQYREDAYLLMRKLKKTGAPATTERDDTGDGEATV